MNKKINAIFWDFDGTLVDTREKNFKITKEIIKKVTDSTIEHIPILNSLEEYDRSIRKCLNWRVFYTTVLGLDEEQTSQAGRLWTQYQLSAKIFTPLFDGIAEVLHSFSGFSQGIISQNSSQAIKTILCENNIENYFDCIIGYEEVGFDFQKPAPKGLLHAINYMDIKNDDCIALFIGDHETDVLFVNNANMILQCEIPGFKLVSIGALYGYDKEINKWQYQPDFKAEKVEDLISIQEEIQKSLCG
jgi:HAD superfamily hydrolase (TIGR01549 family)